jgi:Ca2+/Na+ antiporter
MNMVMTAVGLLLVVLSVEMHPDYLPMELGILLGVTGILLVYIPLINERKECNDCKDRYY